MKTASHSSPTLEEQNGWFRFSLRAPNQLAGQNVEQAFHGTHLGLHSLAASGRKSRLRTSSSRTLRVRCLGLDPRLIFLGLSVQLLPGDFLKDLSLQQRNALLSMSSWCIYLKPAAYAGISLMQEDLTLLKPRR